MISRNDDPPPDPAQERAEALADLITETLRTCKGIDIDDRSVDDAILALMNIVDEAYAQGRADAIAEPPNLGDD